MSGTHHKALIAALLCLLLTAQASFLYARDLIISNMVKNGSMEIASGSSPASWVNSGGGVWAVDASVSSIHSLMLSDHDLVNRYYWVSSGFDLTTGNKYIAEWDWKYAGLTEPCLLEIRFWSGPLVNGYPSGSIISSSRFVSGTGTRGSFYHNIEVFINPHGAKSGDVVLWTSQNGTGKIWMDNVVVRPAPNLVLNPDMEYQNGFVPDSWTYSSGATWATDRYKSSSHSLKVTDSSNTAAEYWASRAIPIFDTCETHLFYSLAYENVSDDGMLVQVRWWTDMDTAGWPAGNCIGVQSFSVGQGTDLAFAEKHQVLTPAKGARFADIVIHSGAAPTGTVWIDDVAMIQEDQAGYSDTATWFPAAKQPRRFIRVNKNGLANDAEALLITSIQGIVAQTRPEIYVRHTSASEDTKWIDDMRNSYNIPYFTMTNASWIIHNFKDHLINNRYILCNILTDSENVATSLAGRFGAAVVDASIEAQAQAAGLVKFMDVRSGISEQNALDQYYRETNELVAMELAENQLGLRDYSTFASVFTFYDTASTLRGNVFNKLLADDSLLLGFWPIEIGEGGAITQSTAAKVSTLPTGQGRNLTAFSSLVDLNIPLIQNTVNDPPVETDKHYVTFLTTDGDNMKMFIHAFADDAGYWANPNRGKFSVGWSCPPMSSEFCPSVLKWFYNNASNTAAARDYFVGGPSGLGYMYPSAFGNNLKHAQMTADLMAKSGLTEFIIIDDSGNGFNPLNYANYTIQPQIQGMIYFGNPYHQYGQTIRWSNGKPIISCQYSLWDDHDSATTLRDKLNSISTNPANPYSQKGYSVVAVHRWSKNLDDINTCISGLNSNIKVITPGEMVKILCKAMDVSPWHFNTDEQGWSGEIASLSSGSFSCTSGYLKISAKDNGASNTDWDCRYWNEFPIAASANSISVTLRADSSSSDANFRIILRDGNGVYTTISDWYKITSTTSAVETYSISAWRGQRVTVYLECDDDTDNNSILRIEHVSVQ